MPNSFSQAHIYRVDDAGIRHADDFCSRCKENRNPLIKHSFYRVGGIQYYWCRECKKEAQRKYYLANRDKFKRMNGEYRERNPAKVTCWEKAKSIKRTPCIICGDPGSTRHHPDYNRPLEVVMLCPIHHREEHRLMKLGKTLLE